MNITKVPILILLPILLFPLLLTSQASIHYCNRTCGSKTLQYPFGFSPGCDISLSCTNSAIYIGEFPVQTIDSENIMITIAAQCNRSIQTLRQLYSPNYAPTFRNAILLQKCSAPISPCVIPATLVQTHFESPSCDADTNNNSTINNSISSSNYNISCYTESQQRSFIDFENVTNRNCSYFVSSIFLESLNNSTSSVSLEVQIVQLGWWLEGNCQCSEYANCTSSVQLPETGRNGSRCKCKDGFEGDGYLAGSDCRKVSSVCNPEKYMSGKCGGTTRVAVLIGGNWSFH
nr:wall-associated receptor kinase-like 14 [Quercus suber]